MEHKVLARIYYDYTRVLIRLVSLSRIYGPANVLDLCTCFHSDSDAYTIIFHVT